MGANIDPCAISLVPFEAIGNYWVSTSKIRLIDSSPENVDPGWVYVVESHFHIRLVHELWNSITFNLSDC